VDVIRETVIPEAARSPFEGRHKVFIIEEADRMNEPAQNAILKTLEEPQPDTVFVLLTGNEEEVLPTIHSRCRVVRLEPVPESRVVELLEEDGASPKRALLAARLADGDFERARHLAEDDDVLSRRSTWLAFADRLLSPVDAMDAAEEVIALTRAAVKDHESLQKQEVSELADAMGEGRGTAAARNALAKRHKRELKRFEEELLGEALGTLASFYRDVLTMRAGASDAVINLDRLDALAHWSDAEVTDAALVAVIDRLVRTRTALGQNANVPLAIEAALLYVADRIAPPAVVDNWA
jgi:DNA polymerase-3 subunit delta'